MTTKTIKSIKKPVTKKKSVKKKKPVLKKAEKLIEVFFGTAYEKKIFDICAQNKFPFGYRRAKIKDIVADFTNRDKRLIIEIYNPARNWEEVQARLKVFLVQGFKTKYITLDRLSMRNWRNSCKTMIEKFLK